MHGFLFSPFLYQQQSRACSAFFPLEFCNPCFFFFQRLDKSSGVVLNKSAFGFYGVFFRWNFATTVFFFSSGLTNPADFDFLLRLCSIKYPVVLVQSSGFSLLPNNPLDFSNHWICDIRWISPKSSGFVGKKKKPNALYKISRVDLVRSSGFSILPNNPLDFSNHWIQWFCRKKKKVERAPRYKFPVSSVLKHKISRLL